MSVPAGPARRVDVVIVSWNHGREVDLCLRSIATGNAGAIGSITVVDNGSRVPFDAPSMAGLPPVTVIRNDGNRGFAPACNQGWANGAGDVVLFLNPDTLLPACAAQTALSVFDEPASADVGAVGLRLANPDGSTQPSCGRFLTPMNVFHQIVGLSLLSPAWFPGLRMTDWDHLSRREVDFASAACLFVRRAVLERLGGFDNRFVLYLEDADLAWRAKARGWRTVFLPEPVVPHRMGWMTGRHRTLRLAHSWRSVMLFARRHLPWGSRWTVQATVLGLGPLARAGQAVAAGSLRDLRASAAATATLWQLLWRDRRASR